jgi:hypothetical protein
MVHYVHHNVPSWSVLHLALLQRPQALSLFLQHSTLKFFFSAALLLSSTTYGHLLMFRSLCVFFFLSETETTRKVSWQTSLKHCNLVGYPHDSANNKLATWQWVTVLAPFLLWVPSGYLLGDGGEPENLLANLHTSLERGVDGIGMKLVDFYQTRCPKNSIQ